jgi:methylated-DNA-[protein]-cysteine S-methyltransferase
MIRYDLLPSPIGRLLITADGEGLTSLSPYEGEEFPADWKRDPKPFVKAARALEAFFDRGKPLPDLPRGAISGGAFQHKVWAAIDAIPFGETRSYGEIAEAVGHPGAARAVGTACGRNPLMLFTPCHRVLAAQGRIGGYGFCGIDVKKKLLRLEGHDR